MDQHRASFETAAEPVLGPRRARTRGQLPHDEEFCLIISMATHAEERPSGPRLEARHGRVAAISFISSKSGNPGPADHDCPRGGWGLTSGSGNRPDFWEGNLC